MRFGDPPQRSSGRFALPAPIIATAAASVLAWLLTGDWIAALALWVLWAGWYWLRKQEGPPVLALAFTFQWVQVTAGIYYYALSGHRVLAMDHSDYQPMVLIGLGCLIALLVGIRIGMVTGRWWPPIVQQEPVKPFGGAALITLYVVLLAVTGPVQALAWQFPAFTQAILALTYFRLALLFMMFRGLAQRPLGWCGIVLLLIGEILFEFTGYFAGFREPLMMAAVALMGVFDVRRLAHWFALGLLLVTMFVTGLMWLSIRTGYREEFENEVFAESRAVRAERLLDLSSAWIKSNTGDLRDDIDAFIERLWVVYYPALAVSRVPSVLPHEDGELLWRALGDTFQPRLLFPDKGVLPSDSEMVIRYSGVWVAGAEQNTSIAFGYAAESYVDFGLPLMFVPVLVWGMILGVGHQLVLRLIHHRELAVAVVTVIFWLSLYLFERSWTKTFGTFATLTIYLGGAAIVADRILLGLRSMSPKPPRAASATPRGPVAR